MEKMKTITTTAKPNNSVIEIEDDDFLLQVAAAEADAIANKRRKLSSDAAEEGLYTAALRGRDIHPPRHNAAVSNRRNDGVPVASGDTCFKCGKSGHWARDCVDAGAGGYGGNFAKDGDVAEKPCPCGMGSCLILTSNTQKNPGRKFYKCPVREENGGCGFFDWCDNAAGTKMEGGMNQSFASDSLFPSIQCRCGAGSCLILTAKTGKNPGQQFYRCPRKDFARLIQEVFTYIKISPSWDFGRLIQQHEDSCGFFKWCNEPSVGDGVSASPYKTNYNMGEKNKSSGDLGNRLACFKCGKEGHWAKDCTMASSNAPAERQRSAPSNLCYKCNKAGHWAKDCSSYQNVNLQRKR